MGVPTPEDHRPIPTARLRRRSPAIQALRAQLRHLAAFDTLGNPHVPTLLLQGETGTGKGLVARVIHDSGPRAAGPFVDVNCAAIPDTLLEAELFGYEAGAFSEAKRAKPGLFEAASAGRCSWTRSMRCRWRCRASCSRRSRRKRVRRLGAVREQAVDVKLIAAAQTELSGAVQAGRFRADLYHRLAVVVLTLPPLRARGEDILRAGAGVRAALCGGPPGAPQAVEPGGGGVAARLPLAGQRAGAQPPDGAGHAVERRADRRRRHAGAAEPARGGADHPNGRDARPRGRPAARRSGADPAGAAGRGGNVVQAASCSG